MSAASKLKPTSAGKSSSPAPDTMRSGKDRPNAIGTRISGVPSCASTELSRHTTIECTMLCGWITTLICSGVRSNNQRASITSRALFIMVAESTEILRPITQLG